MPIPAVAVAPPLSGGGTPDNPGTPEVVVAPSVRSAIYWIASDKTEVLLTGDITGTASGIIVQPGIKGFDAPPYNLALDDLPALDGSAYRNVRATTRELFVPLFLWAPSRGQLVKLKRDLVSRFNPKKGIGTLKVVETDDDGNLSSRFIDCFYSGGMEGDEQEGYGFTFCTFGVILQAPDPYWYGEKQIPAPTGLAGKPPVNFFTGKDRGAAGELTGPFLPNVHLSQQNQPNNQYLIAVNGDVPSWPVWTITGANCDRFTLTRVGQSGEPDAALILNYTFPAGGDVVIIDTRPGYKTVRNSAGTNLWPNLGPNPHLWFLKEGSNNVLIQLSLIGGGSPVTITGNAKLEFYPRYLGA